MGEQSFTNQGGIEEDRQPREAAPAAEELPSFRPVAPRTPADHRASAALDASSNPPVDKKHFVIREDNRDARLARSRPPSLPATARALAATPAAKQKRGAAFRRSSLVLIIGACMGYVGSYLLPGPAHLVGAKIARAPSERWSTGPLAALVDQGERQIAEHRLEAPAGDNALETYRRIATTSPESVETRSFGEHLSLALWSLGVAATQRGDWVEATRYFEIVKTLPIPSTSMVSAETSPLDPAADLDLPHGVVGKFAPEGPALANDPASPARKGAAANDERAWEATLVALRRGDQALRLGDIVSARRFYEFAAAGGITEAATALGQTYDPTYLKSAGVRGVKANPETARNWYEKAARQGDARAAQLLQSLAQN
jgi:Sel1 repeat-containing protein